MAKKWVEQDIVDGVGEIYFSKWQYFIDYVHQEMLDYKHYIWRGQRESEWKLESTLDRLINKAKIAKTKRPEFRTSHLEQFQYAVRGRRGLNPPSIETENDWWALGQHNGLATPLLDWTTSPFVAAYFAFISPEKSIGKYRAIFALSRPAVEEKALNIKRNEQEIQNQKAEKANKEGKHLIAALYSRERKLEVEFIRPKSDENQRLVNQNGLFSRAPDGINLDDWVANNFCNDETYSYILMKLLVPNSGRVDFLRILNRMNINHLTLFPDLYGASKFCNLHAEIESY